MFTSALLSRDATRRRNRRSGRSNVLRVDAFRREPFVEDDLIRANNTHGVVLYPRLRRVAPNERGRERKREEKRETPPILYEAPTAFRTRGRK